MFCAVGLADTDAYIITSPDGITWTERANPGDITLFAITWNGSIFCAVGSYQGINDAYIVTSPDGITWTERANPKNESLLGIAWNGSIFCAVGAAAGTDAYIITSPDGITWTERANPKNLVLNGITWGNSIFCAVGWTDTIANLIERPDHVMKHFIDVLYGFALTDVDTSSFSAAGTSYAGAITGGYKFAFVIDSEITPSKFLAELAFQCRSNLKYEGGKWYLNYLPDTAPSAVKTISKSELAGQFSKFTFNKTDRKDIVNDLTAKFQKNYGGLTYDESDWLGTSIVSDATSQTNYGVRPETYEFWAVRLQAMADHVIVFIKLQRKNPLLIIEFPVFWEHFNLERGDTFDIDNDLYDAKKFYLEKIERIDKFKLKISGIEWP